MSKIRGKYVARKQESDVSEAATKMNKLVDYLDENKKEEGKLTIDPGYLPTIPESLETERRGLLGNDQFHIEPEFSN